MKVSLLENFYAKNILEKDLYVVLNDIRDGRYKSVIDRCRHFSLLGDKEKYKELKVKLPIVTFCGTFKGGRKLNNLDVYNSIMIIDIDGLTKLSVTSVKRNLSLDPYIFAIWISPSGLGLKALVKVDSDVETHKASFDSIKLYLEERYEVEIDSSGSDVTRLCFVSYDEELIINEDSNIYVEKFFDETSKGESKKTKKVQALNKSLTKNAYATEGLNRSEHRKTLSNIIKYLKRNKITITNSFDEWFRVAIAISVTFSYDLGQKYFLLICEQDMEKHDEYASNEILKYCYNNRKMDGSNSITFGTIIFYAQQKGFKLKGGSSNQST